MSKKEALKELLNKIINCLIEFIFLFPLKILGLYIYLFSGYVRGKEENKNENEKYVREKEEIKKTISTHTKKRKITKDDLKLSSRLSFSGAGVSVASIVVMSTISNMTVLLVIATCFFSISLPLFVMMALFYEICLWAGPKYYEHSKQIFFNQQIVFVQDIAYLSIAIAVFLVIVNLSIYAGIIFLVVSLIAGAFYISFFKEIIDHIKNKDKSLSQADDVK